MSTKSPKRTARTSCSPDTSSSMLPRAPLPAHGDDAIIVTGERRGRGSCCEATRRAHAQSEREAVKRTAGGVLSVLMREARGKPLRTADRVLSVRMREARGKALRGRMGGF